MNTKLLPGIGIYPKTLVHDRVRIYDGVEFTTTSHYLNGSVVPYGEARALTEDEIGICNNPDQAESASVTIVPACLPLKQADRTFLEWLLTVPTMPDGVPHEHDLAFQNVQRLGRQVARDFLLVYRSEQSIDTKPISVRAPGLLTSTSIKDGSKLIGLHLDSFFGAPLRDRAKSPSRFCINLTHEPRRLLVLNLPISKMLTMIADTDEARDGTVSAGNIETVFFRKFPGYPVLEIRINPGEAYLAPTENLIHDGSTILRTSRDAFATFLGPFCDGIEASQRIAS